MARAQSACVYRLYDAAGALLYVGASGAWITRLGGHLAHLSWGREIATVTIRRYATFRAAFDAEREAIAGEHPRFNVMHNCPPSRQRRGELQQAILDLIRAAGPLSVRDVDRALRRTTTGTMQRMVKNGDLMVVAERQAAGGPWPTAHVYGLPGQEVAA